MYYFRVFFLLGAVLLAVSVSCTTTEPFYATDELREFDRSSEVSNEAVDHIFYLLGDTGKPKLDGRDPVFTFLKEQFREHTDKSSVIFLGDNIYEEGMPASENHPERELTEKRILVALQSLNGLNHSSFFIPGNHDWKFGQDGLLAQQNFIESFEQANAAFVPVNGCPGPFHSLIGNDWLFIAIDSEWIVKQGARAETDSGSCDNRSLDEVLSDIEVLVNEYSDKSLLVATHHPLYSNGPHGGFFTWKDHLFPLTNLDSRYVLPMPILGSVYPVYRKVGNSRQDISNGNYQKYITGLLEVTEPAKKRVFASGHEHNLAFFDKEDHLSIVSGSGSKTSPSRGENGADFVISENGYARLISYNNGDLTVEFWIPSKVELGTGELIFKKDIRYRESADEEDEQNVVVEQSNAIESTKTVAPGESYKAGWLKETIWGKHYRDVWAASIEAPVIDLNQKRGGLDVVSVGGGQQSVSIVVEDSTGQKSMMRSIDKDPSEALPEVLRQTFANTIIQDQISASHPYGAVAVGELADAAGIYHTDPEIGFLPETPGLDIPGVEDGALVMFENFVSVPWLQENYGKAANRILGSNGVWVSLRENKDYKIDEKQFIRSRLFDMFLGDWDRHQGQWFWAEIETEEGVVYEPIPIDRDNVFFKSDGLIPRVASRQWALRKFQHFDNDIRDIKGINFNARHIDRWFLTEADKEVWLEVADDLQDSMTDEDIDSAVEQWPESALEISGEEIATKLKERREKIGAFAERYYNVLAKEVNVYGTDLSENFTVVRTDNGSVQVQRSVSGNIVYDRIFTPNETDEVRIFGFDEDDSFEISGTDSKKILVRIIPGAGFDTFSDRVKGTTGKSNVVVYDTFNGIQANISEATIIRYSRQREVHNYNREGFDYDVFAPLLSGGFNPDDGVFLGGGMKYVREGFRKEPYASLHEFTVKHSLSTSAFSVNIKNNFMETAGSLDLLTELSILAPNFRANYFGLGNETDKTNSSSSFYRFRMNQVHANVSLRTRISSITSITFGTEYAYYEPSEYAGRFISSEDAGLGSEDFQGHHFGSISGDFQINTVDNEVVPYYGFRFRTDASLNVGLDNSSETFLSLGSEGSLYYTLQKLNSTLGFRIGGETNIGDFNFFRANTLGGSSMLGEHGRLRGYLRDRFAGRTAFYQNTEVRTRIIDFESYLFPASVGIIGFLDNGRVWLDDEDSDKWHQGYGGGIWFSPFRRAVLSVTYDVSEEDRLFSINAGFTF